MTFRFMLVESSTIPFGSKYFFHIANLCILISALAKNGSFGFAKGWLVCWAKPNVPFVRLAKIVFKKCAVGKNKNTEALAFGSAV